MNSIKLLFGGIVVLVISLVIWSCTDDFTEGDLLRLQAKNDSIKAVQAKDLSSEKDSIALSIQVYNATISVRSAGGRTAAVEGLAGVTVTISADGKNKTATADADGLTNFYVQPGSISGTVKGTGFTTVNFTLSVTEAEDDEGNESGEALTNASVAIPTFETTGTRLARVTGSVTAELNTLNNTRENVPDGVGISFSPYFIDYSFLDAVSTGADIDKLSIEGTFIATTTNGAFSIDLPTAVDGLFYKYAFSDFTADQQIAIDGYENDLAGSVRAAVTIPTRFISSSLPSNGFTYIPNVRPVQVDIADPPAAGTGAAITVTLLPQTIGSFTVLAPGSGYPASSTTVTVTVTGGDFDAAATGAAVAALTASTDANGQVTGITGTPGFGYKSQATLTVGGGGTGAVVKVNYTSTLAPLFSTAGLGTSTLTAGGSGYEVAPTLVVRGYDASGNYIEGVSTGVTVLNGAVVNATMPGTSFSRLLAATPAVFRPVSRLAAIADVADFNVNALGEITLPAPSVGVGLTGTATVQGTGYSLTTPAAVTVRGLRGGTGAIVGANMSGGGINYLYTIARGSGYSTLANANFPTGATGFATTGVYSGTVLRPGISYTVNAYYGTGIKTIAVQ